MNATSNTRRRAILLALAVLVLTCACNFVIDTGGEDGITLEEHDELYDSVTTNEWEVER